MNQQFDFDPGRQPDYQLHVSVGEPASLYGQTRVTLEGSGGVTVEHRRGTGTPGEAASQAVSGTLDDPAAVFHRLAAFDWGRTFPSRPGIPDEAVIVWTVSLGGEAIASVRMWLGEARTDPHAAPVYETLRRAVSELSERRFFL